MLPSANNNVNNTLKAGNLKKVFRTIWKHGPIERKEIQNHVNLSWGAISQFCNQLIDAGIVVQTSNPKGNVGKIPNIIDVNVDDNYLIGIDLAATTIRAMILNLKGEAVETQIRTVMSSLSVTDQLISIINALLVNYIGRKNILAIGVSCSGNVDTETGTLLQLMLAPTWKNIEIKKELEKHFNIPTFVLRDPDCVLYAEKYLGTIYEHQYKNVLHVNINYGIGAAVMVDSKVYTSIGKTYGEIGHTKVKTDGTLCNCGRRGCLEMYASKLGIVHQFVEAINNGEKSSITASNSTDFSYETILSHAQMGDELCRRLFQQAGHLMGHVFANLATVFDPEAIILYGDLARAKDLWEENLMETYNEEIYPQTKTIIHFSQLDASAPMVGVAFYAFELIMDEFLSETTAKN